MAKAWHLIEKDGIARIEIDTPGTEVNVLDTSAMQELKDILTTVSKTASVKAVLFTSGKNRIFIAGADIKEIRGIRTREDAINKADNGKEIFDLIENLDVPTICVINGACLGGGYELALACDWRMAASSDKVKIGLPEVNLGILPGFGGSIRLPRLLGPAASLPLILGGLIVSAKKAVKFGMVDRLVAEDKLLDKSIEFAKELIVSGTERKKRNAFLVFLEKSILGPLVIYPTARKDILRRTKGHYPAPLKALELVQKTYGDNSPQAYKKESEMFADLAVTHVSKNLIELFFLNEKYKKTAWTSLKGIEDGVRQCGVIGAGIMGGGIAQLVSHKEIPVKVKDINEKALEGAIQEARRIYEGAVKKGKLSEADKEAKMALISIKAPDEEVASSDIIIEAVVEDLAVKEKVFKYWGEKTEKKTILASNTSSLPVTKMAAACRYPERVIGLHFFNPVNRMPLVEVIRAEQSSEETIERTVQFARRLGKTVIVVKDSPGFLVNRLLLPYMNEAAFMIEEGINPEKIDRAARNFGMPMGPVELVDQVGIDVGYKVAHILHHAFGDRMKVASVLETAKSKGLLGKKSGKGFYLYDKEEKTVNTELLSSTVKDADNEMIIHRLIYIMVNEAARCLDEKVVDSAATADIGMITGTGFPPFRAGLLRYADSEGIARIVSKLEELAKSLPGGGRFEPCGFLRKLAADGRGFYPS